MQLRDSVALVTGANRGIGIALVESLLERGASRVYATGRQLATLAAAVALDEKRVVPLRIDVTRPSDFVRASAIATDVSLLVNNAGVLNSGSVLDLPLEAFQRNLAVNFFGVVNAARGFAPTLIRNGGAVLNILTIVALASMPSFGVYNASKAAAWSLTQSLRGELARRGVAVFSAFPAAVDTDMLREFRIPKTSPRSVAAAIVAGIEAGTEDIFPDSDSAQMYRSWAADHKAVERQFSTL
jgi:NAD(P)-dependent dehydrogenase (short-subunit alcohol dehydrogenase family)